MPSTPILLRLRRVGFVFAVAIGSAAPTLFAADYDVDQPIVGFSHGTTATPTAKP